MDASSSQSSCRPLCAAIKRLAPAAPPKKQYLLDRIATSDGFQQGKEDTSSTLKRLLTALEDALTSHADVAGVGAADADILARIATDDALRALAALLERCACDGAWEGWLQAARRVTPRRHRGSRGPRSEATSGHLSLSPRPHQTMMMMSYSRRARLL